MKDLTAFLERLPFPKKNLSAWQIKYLDPEFRKKTRARINARRRARRKTDPAYRAKENARRKAWEAGLSDEKHAEYIKKFNASRRTEKRKKQKREYLRKWYAKNRERRNACKRAWRAKRKTQDAVV